MSCRPSRSRIASALAVSSRSLPAAVRQAEQAAAGVVPGLGVLRGLEVLERGGALDHADVLEGAAEAHRRLDVRRRLGDVAPAVGHRAGVRRVEAGDAVERRRLAGAVRPDQPDDLELVDLEVRRPAGPAARRSGSTGRGPPGRRSRRPVLLGADTGALHCGRAAVVVAVQRERLAGEPVGDRPDLLGDAAGVLARCVSSRPKRADELRRELREASACGRRTRRRPCRSVSSSR